MMMTSLRGLCVQRMMTLSELQVSVGNPTMDDSSDDDFVNLPGPSTRARVKRKEWPDPDDPGGTTSKKVGGSGRTPQAQNSENMTKEEQKKEAARLRQAKSRAKKNESEKKRANKEAQARMAQNRNAMTDEQREEVKEADRQRKAQKKEAMTSPSCCQSSCEHVR